MNRHNISASESLLLNSKQIPLKARTRYGMSWHLRAIKGASGSCYIAVMILGEGDKEIKRFVRYVRTFDGIDETCTLRFDVPDGALSAVIGYRINIETPSRSDVSIMLPDIHTLNLDEARANEPEMFDELQGEHTGAFRNVQPTISSSGLVQDYESVWDTYSKQFGKSQETQGMSHLGDEWWNEEFVRSVFSEYILPHLRPDSIVGELGVGGGKYSSLVAPHVRTLYGIDISREMLGRTKSRLEKEGYAFNPIKTKGTRIDLPDKSLDLFYSIDSCVHIFPYDLYTYCIELGRILKIGGIGVIEFADWDLDKSFEKFVFDYEILQKTRKLNTGAFGFLTKQAIRQFLENNSLSQLSCKSVSGRTSIITFIRQQ